MKRISKVLTFILTFLTIAVIVNAEEMPGARSATNSNGDVFLGGNYIEVGISKGGSFGTSAPAPESFHSHATSKNAYKLGLISDGDGWDVGNDPTTGDFFLPGTPEERLIISYKIDGTIYNHIQGDRVEKKWQNTIKELEVKDESDTEKGILKATVTGITKENVKVEITYSFEVNDKYYLTEVKITNLGNKDITDVRFIRSFDPDQDEDINDTFETYNKVICNPSSTQEGSDTNYAMVVARGKKTHDGFFFLAFDNRARASRGVSFAPNNAYMEGLWKDIEELPTYSTDEDLKISNDDTNGYTKEDNAIAITFNLQTLEKTQSTTLEYYSSLDPNVISSISNILKAVSAKIKTFTDTKIEIETQEGYEYSIDDGKNWQDSGVFENLEPGKEYKILSRIKATPTTEASEPEETILTTKNSGPKTPNIKVLSITEDSIMVQEIENYEYSIDNGTTWQKQPLFSDLIPNTEYKIIARYSETESTMYGTLTEPIIITTLEKEPSELDNLTNVKIHIDLNNDSPIVSISKAQIYRKLNKDDDVKKALENNDDIDIKFIVKASIIDEEKLKQIKENLNEKEIVAFNIDATIKLFINNDYVKDITTSNEKITFKINVPDEYIKSNRKFYIIRTHIDETGKIEYERLEDIDNDDTTITISSDKFSDFIITYIDQTEINNPETGDNIINYINMLIISLITLASTYTYKKISIKD